MIATKLSPIRASLKDKSLGMGMIVGESKDRKKWVILWDTGDKRERTYSKDSVEIVEPTPHQPQTTRRS